MYREQVTDTLRKFSYGFYLLSAKFNENFAVGAVNWVSQVSFHPPMVMAAVRKKTNLNDTIFNAKYFAVNVVGENQESILPDFFKSTNVENGKINGLPFTAGKHGSPLFIDCPASIECKVTDTIECGDHNLFIGEVLKAGMRYDTDPLVDKETKYKYAG